MNDDDERMKRLQELADAEQPMEISLSGPGPFSIPKCGPQISAQLLEDGQTFVLELETEKSRQRVLVPIDGRALLSLETLARNLRKSYGVGETRN